MNRYYLYKSISFFIYLFAQVLIFDKIVIFGTAHSIIYIAFLLTLPIELAIIPSMLIGFALGLGIDAFNNTFGIHAAASIILMYLRPTILSWLTPQGGYPTGVIPRPNIFGIGWFTSYALPLVFIHLLIVFYVEAGGFDLFWHTLLEVVASTIYSYLLIVIIQYTFFTKSRK